MTPEDLRILCTALGFTAVVTEKGLPAADLASRALDFASLIESFCTRAVTDLASPNQEDFSEIDRLIENLKSGRAAKGATDLENKDRETLFKIHNRLLQRLYARADEPLLAQHILKMLDDELNGTAAQKS